jgi:hypothetical protein
MMNCQINEISNLASKVFSSFALGNAKINTQIGGHTLSFHYGEEYLLKSLLPDCVHQLPLAIKIRKYVDKHSAREHEFSVSLKGLVKS